jgi:hypothetical protein
MVQVSSKNPFESNINDLNSNGRDKVIFIPEPRGDGDLYFISSGSGLKKLDLSIKNIVENYVGNFDHSDLVYSGKKESKVIAIDPITGETLSAFDDSNERVSSTVDIHEDSKKLKLDKAVLISRTTYT